MLVGVLLVCSMSPTFMLGIYHWGEWVKRDLAQPIYARVERGSPIFDWFIAFINAKFITLIFICKFIDVCVDFMADMFMIFLSPLCWLYVCFMTTNMYGC